MAYADAGTGTATSGTDYTALADGTLTFAADVLSDTLAVAVIGDGMDEPNETVVITLNSLVNATFTGGEVPLNGIGTIIDDDAPVSIPDAGLRAVIEDSLNKASGATISPTEMATLTRLIAPSKNIRDLTGLEFATGLDTLDLSDNNIEDIEPLVNNAGLGAGVAIDLRGNPLSAQSCDVHVPALEARGVSVQVSPATNLDIDNDGTADLTDAIMVILYLFGLENEGITDYILFSQQATRTDPEAVTDYIASLLP